MKKIGKVERHANPAAVELLTRLLSEARQGDITQFAVVGIDGTGDHFSEVVGAETPADGFKMLGQLEMAKAHVMSGLLDGMEVGDDS